MSIRIDGIDEAKTCDDCRFCFMSMLDGNTIKSGIMFWCFFDDEQKPIKDSIGSMSDVKDTIQGYKRENCPIHQIEEISGK